MAPHAESPTALASDGKQEEVNAGEAQLEPGVKKSIAQGKMIEFPSPPTFDDKHKERDYLKGKLACAFRIFAKYGYDEGVAGHITLRDPVEPDCFWVNPFGRAFGLMNKSDLILVNHDGEVIDGGENRLLNTAAYMIHAAVHAARPDVMCAAHSHSIYGRTFCTLAGSSTPSLKTAVLSTMTMSSTTASTAWCWRRRRARTLQPVSDPRRLPCYKTTAF